MRTLIALLMALLLATNAHAVKKEFKWENCVGAGNFKMNANVCRVTDPVTRESEWVVTVGVGFFGDTQAMGQGYEAHSALVGTFTFSKDEVKSVEEARAKAEALFAESAQVKSISAQSAPMCSAAVAPDALELIRKWVEAAEPPANQCKKP